jgi:dTDP-glucose 4,6-dehydratase
MPDATPRPSRHLLVTGGAGFIGSSFVHAWCRQHPADAVTVLDALTYASNLESLRALVDTGVVTFVHGDITDRICVAQVLEAQSIDTVVHFAAESHVDRSIADPDAFLRTNVMGTLTLLRAVQTEWSKNGVWRSGVRFHHASSDEVYGTLASDEPPFVESSPYAPSSPYAASKASADHLVRAWIRTYGLPATISNCSNNYGPWQFPEKLIPLIIVNALRGLPLPIFGDGLQVRDWLYVDDHCRAIELVLNADVTGQTFNVGGRAEHTNLHIVASVCALIDDAFDADTTLRERFPECPAAMGKRCDELIAHVTDRLGHDRRYALNPTKIATTLGFEPKESLATGLQRTVAWYLDNETWWRPLLP